MCWFLIQYTPGVHCVDFLNFTCQQEQTIILLFNNMCGVSHCWYVSVLIAIICFVEFSKIVKHVNILLSRRQKSNDGSG